VPGRREAWLLGQANGDTPFLILACSSRDIPIPRRQDLTELDDGLPAAIGADRAEARREAGLPFRR
jgi:hypothetical protein